MKASELRKKYIDFFVSKEHVQIPSASLIPENDPSVLFTTAGMHPLVPYLMGEEHPAGKRLVDYQKCVRTGDINEVGDATHLTFFEMLGNWSLGDYFKDESIEMSWTFLTDKKWLGLDAGRLAVSVFAGDDDAPFDEEAYDKWLALGVPEARIAKLGKKDNWWGPPGDTGPCGPDTEIFYWASDDKVPQDFQDTHDDPKWVEIWNNVFIQYQKKRDGSFKKLKKPSVDTGMGLERTIAALQGKKSVYETDLFESIISAIEQVTSKKYGADEESKSMRIIADHLRSGVMMIADGIKPSNKDQGYVLRRLIRRAIRHGRQLGVSGSDLVEPVAGASIKSLRDAYPELDEKRDQIIGALDTEAKKFDKTIEKGLRQVEKIWKKQKEITGHDAFDLYQSYGFPLELTEEIAGEYGQAVDKSVFEEEFKKHQELSRAGAGKKFAGGLVDHSEETTRLHTATHLVHQALRQVLGDHVEQRGSNITKDRLRFDFSHPKKVTKEEVSEVEKIVNDAIKAKFPVKYELLTMEEAKKRGAIGLFEDKYAQLEGKVKVYTIGNSKDQVSVEICGGPHVENTSELSSFKIKKEEASSAGVRRIKAVLS